MLRTFFNAIIFLLSLSAIAAPGDDNAIKLEIPVIADIQRHLDMLTVPSYAALALENTGLSVSLSSRLVLKGRDSFQIKAGTIKFLGKTGQLYKYEASLNLSADVEGSTFSVPFEVDTSGISSGALRVRAYPPMAKLMPRELVDRIEFKVRSLANIQSQKEVISYLDRLGREPEAKARGFEGILEAILFESYNKSGPVSSGAQVGDKGKAEPLSDQFYLLITLVIWVIGFPVFLLILRARRRSAGAT